MFDALWVDPEEWIFMASVFVILAGLVLVLYITLR
jgi:hypothetical protein